MNWKLWRWEQCLYKRDISNTSVAECQGYRAKRELKIKVTSIAPHACFSRCKQGKGLFPFMVLYLVSDSVELSNWSAFSTWLFFLLLKYILLVENVEKNGSYSDVLINWEKEEDSLEDKTCCFSSVHSGGIGIGQIGQGLYSGFCNLSRIGLNN